MKRYSTLILATCAVVCATQVVHAESLWKRRNPRFSFLFTDNNARRVGDLLTVIVRETTDIEHSDQRNMDKQSESGGRFSFAGESSGGLEGISAAADLDGSASTNRSFGGSAQYNSAREFLDRITVTVVDVLPNGNLLISGKRRRNVSGESRVLRISGVVRPFDIATGNIVQSQYIANFQIGYEGRGDESSFSNQGWFSRTVNRIWPF